MVIRSEGEGGQGGLFAVEPPPVAAVPLLMSLNPAYYELIWAGQKRHEFRRRFVRSAPVTWYVYLTAPMSRLAAVIDLGPAVVAAPERVAAIAEEGRAGNGASVLAYVRDLPEAFAIPILRVREYEGVAAAELAAELGRFQPPQGYVLLDRYPELARVCEKLTGGVPLREMTAHHGIA